MPKNNNNMFEKRIKYIERFYNPEFTTYDFLALLSALYVSQKDYSFNRDNLINFIRPVR